MELKKYKLGDIAEITSSKRIFESEYCESGIPFIRGQEISNESIASTTSKFECYISEERYNELKSKYGVPNKNDILITAVGTIGNVYLVEDNKKFYFKDGNIIWFKNIKNVVCPEFLLYFMKSPIFKQQINRSLIGAVQKALTIVMLAEIQISLPPLSVQKNIASILSAYDRKIALNRLIKQNLEALAKQLYDYWFVQFDFPNEEGKPYKSSGGKMVWNEKLKRNIPEGWKISPLREIVDLEDSKRIPLSNVQRAERKGTYPYYGATGIMDYINDFIFDYDILLLAEDGSTSDSEGFPIVQYVWGKVWVNNHAHIILPKDRMHLIYTYFLLKSIPAKSIETGSIQKKISQENLLAYNTICVPKYLKDLYTKRMMSLWEKKKLTTEEISNLTKQRDELLPLLMNGQVTIE